MLAVPTSKGIRPLGALVLSLLVASAVFAQPAPAAAPARLDTLVAPVALYPDRLLAQLLAAATFHEQIPAAAHWADLHRQLTTQALVAAMQTTRLPWDPTVQAMLPFPSVLDRMAHDGRWTASLGDAALAQLPEVMDAIQRQRHRAEAFGYLRSNEKIAVSSGEYITILPVKPAVIPVPSYDPHSVFAPLQTGSAAASAVRFEDGVLVGGFQPFGWNLEKFAVIGGYFQAWGWGLENIDWAARSMIINDAPWQRNWDNRREYVHPYPDLQRVTSP